MTTQRYEWQRVRIEYVQGRENGDGTLEWPTLEQLAQEYSIAPIGSCIINGTAPDIIGLALLFGKRIEGDVFDFGYC